MNAQRGLIVAVSLGVIIALSLLAASADIAWEAWRPASCMPDRCFCEGVREATVRQPANTWSNLGFVLLGLCMLSASGADAERIRLGRLPASVRDLSLGAVPGFSVIFGTAVLVNGLGSMFFHASLSFAGQWLDVLGMYLIATFLLLYNLARLLPLKASSLVGTWIGVNAVGGWLLLSVPAMRRQGFAALILLSLASELVARSRDAWSHDGRLLAGSLACLAAAFTLWILDIQGVLCTPDSLVQGHAGWHLLTTASVGLLYLYYRSESHARYPRPIVPPGRVG